MAGSGYRAMVAAAAAETPEPESGTGTGSGLGWQRGGCGEDAGGGSARSQVHLSLC